MFNSDSVGGADESRKGFSNSIPVNVTERSTLIQPPNIHHQPTTTNYCSGLSTAAQRTITASGHPVGAAFLVPLRRHLLRPRPEFDRASAGDVTNAEFGVVPPAE